MAQLYAGTSGWAYPNWKPDFYPAKLAQAKFLGYYATQLNAVEVNFTFRQLVKDTTIQKWIESTPAGFCLSPKAHQVITHIKRLKKTEDFLPRFMTTLEPLAHAGKMGPVLVSTPAQLQIGPGCSGRISVGAAAKVSEPLLSFAMSPGSADDAFALLKKYNRAICVAESEERNHSRCRHGRLLLLPLPQTGVHG